jgi:hypothetical protein
VEVSSPAELRAVFTPLWSTLRLAQRESSLLCRPGARRCRDPEAVAAVQRHQGQRIETRLGGRAQAEAVGGGVGQRRRVAVVLDEELLLRALARSSAVVASARCARCT